MQFLFGSAKAPAGQPVLLSASNGAQGSDSTTTWSKTVQFDNEAGDNRLLVMIYMSEDNAQKTHLSPLYDGKAGTLIGQKGVDGGQALVISASYWKESELPSSSGGKTFEMTHSGLQAGHGVIAFLWKDVDQATPVGTLKSLAKTSQTPTYQMSITAASLSSGKGVMLAVGQADSGPTPTQGDCTDARSNMNDIILRSTRGPGPATPGGQFASSWDIIPSTSDEVYDWNTKFGNSTSVDAAVALLVPINGV